MVNFKGFTGMEMQQTRYFLAVCETLNFTRAAENCAVSQPALTRAIKKLEEELGEPLLLRDKRHVSLTPFGEMIRNQLRKVDEAWRDTLASAKAFQGLERSVLNLGIMCTVGPAMVMNFLNCFREANPGIALNIKNMDVDELDSGLISGAVEIGLFGLIDSMDSRFSVHRLYSEPLVAVFMPGHRFGRMKKVPFDALDGENYVDRLNCEFRDALADLIEKRGMQFEIPYVSEREDWIQEMVAAGIGISIMPKYSVTLPSLQCRPIVKPVVEREVALVTLADRKLSAGSEAFLASARGFVWPKP
ncbi:MAG TPA: LysR family transcriptional regulator [Rhodospirillaceae bacterium]|nr:LysR family transcriptional regulator [Rhodospirillaceae bacterium]